MTCDLRSGAQYSQFHDLHLIGTAISPYLWPVVAVTSRQNAIAAWSLSPTELLRPVCPAPIRPCALFARRRAQRASSRFFRHPSQMSDPLYAIFQPSPNNAGFTKPPMYWLISLLKQLNGCKYWPSIGSGDTMVVAVPDVNSVRSRGITRGL
jgi:hypothetical protein